MASGSFTGTTGNKHIQAKIEWSSTPDVLTNTSRLTVSLYYKKSSQSTAATYGTGSFTISIDYQADETFSKYIRLEPNDTWVLAATRTVTVKHNNDGSMSLAISAKGGISGLSFSSTSCFATVILDTIPRATAPTFGASTQTIGSNMIIYLNAADASFYHTITYSWGSLNGTIGSNLKTSKTWEIPIDFCTGVPNGTQGTLFITVETFTSTGASLGKVTRSTPCNVPASVVPTISAVTITDTGGNVPTGWGVYVRGKSVLHVNVTASGKYYSSIRSYSIKALGVTEARNDVDMGITSEAGSVEVEVTVTDSRGRTASTKKTITVQEYSEPTIETFTLERANNLGTVVDNGTFAKIKLKGSGSSVGEKNSVEAKIYHMRSDTTTWTLAKTIPVKYAIDQTIMIADMIASRSYAVKVELSDVFTSTVAESVLNAEGAVIGWLPGGIGISFGKAAEEAYTADFNWKIHGRKGAQFDEDVNVSAAIIADDYKIGDLSMLHPVDILSVSRGGANMQLGTSSAYVSVGFTHRIYSFKDLLTLSDGGIRIPEGVRAVRITAQVCLGVSSAGVRYVQTSINNFNNTMARSQKHHASSATPETHTISGAVTPVSPGDTIILGVYGTATDWVYGIYNQTYLTVEAYA